MIIVKLIGGVGNQLFQYAAGRRLAHMRKTGLKLDINGYQNEKKRKYSLGVFNIVEDFATIPEIDFFKKYKRNMFFRFYNNLSANSKKKYIEQKENGSLYFHFNPRILNLGKNVYLEGYWQSEKYFHDTEDIIRKEFTLKNGYKNFDNDLLKNIGEVNSIAIHIRRQDYVSDLNTFNVHGICSLEYYFKAVDFILEKIRDPYFFIFTDDIKWTKDNFSLKYPCKLVSDKKNRDYEDLYLMSKCKHHIIANSTFSWWSAWMCENKNKTVIAPQKWLNDPQYNIGDIIPEKWIKI